MNKIFPVSLVLICLTAPYISLTLPSKAETSSPPTATSSGSSALELPIEWDRFLSGINANCAVQISDGGFLILGTNYTVLKENNTYSHRIDQVLVKTDSEGNISWTRTYHVEGFQQLEPGLLTKTSDGDYVIACTGVSESSPQSIPTSAKVCLLRIDTQGNVEWSKSLQAFNPDHTDVNGFQIDALIETSNHGFAIITFYNHGMYAWENWFIKVDASGTLEWSKNIEPLLNSGETAITNILPSGDGYILTGYIGGHLADFHGPMVIVKVDSTGNPLWENQFGGEGDYYYTACTDSIATSDAGYILAGSSSSYNNGASHGWLVKTNSQGVMSWNGSIGSDGSQIFSIAQTSQGDYIFVGSIKASDAGWVGKIDQSFGLIAETEVPRETSLNAIVLTNDNSCVFATKAGYLVKIGLEPRQSSPYPSPTPSPSVPELPTWVLLFVFVLVAVVAAEAVKPGRRRPSSNTSLCKA